MARSRQPAVPPWDIPRTITREAVESWCQTIPHGADEVVLRIGHRGCTSGPGGSEALQSVLCLLHRRGVRTLLAVPPATFTDERRRALFDRTDPLRPGPHDRGTDVERSLAYRLPGLVLAQLCDDVGGAHVVSKVRAWQAAAVTGARGQFGHGKYHSLAVIGALDHRTRLRDSGRTRRRLLESSILDLLSIRAYNPTTGAPDSLQELVEFVYQATENTFDHARLDLQGNRIRQVRTVSVERHIVGHGAGAVSERDLGMAADTPLSTYLRRLQQHVAALGKSRDQLNLLAVTVADGGVGIAARMHGGLDVYTHDLHHENKVVEEAILPGSTSKPVGELGRGGGLMKMMRSTRYLDGFFELRTGRLALARTYLAEDGRRDEDSDFSHRDSSAFDLHGHEDEQPLVAGTSVTLLFPESVIVGGASTNILPAAHA